jgi:hypothetical protein
MAQNRRLVGIGGLVISGVPTSFRNATATANALKNAKMVANIG